MKCAFASGRTVAFLLVTIAALLAGVAHYVAAQEERKPPSALRREISDAAADVVKSLRQRVDAGEALTPTLVEVMFEWSRRVYLSGVAADPARDARAQAAREHLARVKELHQVLEARFQQGIDVSRVQVAQATYYLREAELWVAEAQGQ